MNSLVCSSHKLWNALSERIRAVLILSIVTLLVLLPGSGVLPLIDRDEPRFAQATREMIDRNDWVVPHFNGEYRFDKPVMIYWLMRVCMALFGENEMAARIPAIIASFLTAFVIFELGRAMFSARVGLFAGIFFLGSFQVLLHGRLAVADMPMVLAVAASHLALIHYLRASSTATKRRAFVWFFLMLGFGFLVKGPIALCPLLTLLVYRWLLWRKSIGLNPAIFLPGLGITLGVISLWGIPALIATHGEFWNVGVGEHVVKRGYESFNERWIVPFYYIPAAFLSLYPWLGFAGLVLVFLRKNWSENHAFLISWALVLYAIFSFYATQLPHYVLPAFPALYLLLAHAMEKPLPMGLYSKLFFLLANGLLILPALLLVWLAFSVEFTPETAPLRVCLWAIAAVLFTLLLVALGFRMGAWQASVLLMAVLGLAFSFLASSARMVAPAVKLAPLFSEMPQGTSYHFHGYTEPSLVYYADAIWKPFPMEDAQPTPFLDSQPALYLFLHEETRLEDFFKAQWKGKPPAPRQGRTPTAEMVRKLHNMGYKIARVQGVNFARTSWVSLEVWYRIDADQVK